MSWRNYRRERRSSRSSVKYRTRSRSYRQNYSNSPASRYHRQYLKSNSRDNSSYSRNSPYYINRKTSRNYNSIPKCRKRNTSMDELIKNKKQTLWRSLKHNGPLFAPEYEPLPRNVNFYYNRKIEKLSKNAEEAATFYAKFYEHHYSTRETFKKNFFEDWRCLMNERERRLIVDFRKCDFREIHEYFLNKIEERKNMPKECKMKIKEEKESEMEFYGICLVDGMEEKVGNFRVEPPSLFIGRGDHPKMGKIKMRVEPEDVIINCSPDAIPTPPRGHKWKYVVHDNTVAWLASWTENIQGTNKYVMFNQASTIRSEKDHRKFEKARELGEVIEEIRESYHHDFKSNSKFERELAVAVYLIDKFCLRVGNEKDKDQADTVGCCSLRCEHLKLINSKNREDPIVIFDFLGKDSIQYKKEAHIDRGAFHNLKEFVNGKRKCDLLFDQIKTSDVNEHLNGFMEGLTAKVFRTFNASKLLECELDETPSRGTLEEKLHFYNEANRQVAILCNHRRTVPKSYESSIQKIDEKIEEAIEARRQIDRDLKRLKPYYKEYEKIKLKAEKLCEKIERLEIKKESKERGKDIAIGTSKANYIDPRITIAWCQIHNVPIERIYNPQQRDRFQWAFERADENFRFDSI